MSVPQGTFLTIIPAVFPSLPLAAPAIAADLHGLAVSYVTNVVSGSPALTYPVLNLAFSNDLDKFAVTSWLFLVLWDLSSDAGPPPPDLSTASGIGGLWLSWDFVDICCGRGYLSVSAKALLGSPVTPSAFQQLYVGVLQWNSVAVP